MGTREHPAGTERGFTLLELMITVAILAILAMIGYTTYIDSVRESRRTEAKSALQEAMNRQERFYTTNNTYTGDVTDLNYNNDPFTTEDGWYQVSAGQCAGGAPLSQCVLLTAAPQGDQNNDTCNDFMLNSRGQRTVSGAGDCW